jgi:hypothetical protein
MEPLSIILLSISLIAYSFLIMLSIQAVKRRQRREIMPDIILIPGRIYFFWNYKNGFLFPDIWTANPRGRLEPDNRMLPCINIGQGTAKNICIWWDFNISGFSNLIIENDRDRLIRIKHIKDHICIDMLFPKNKYPAFPENYSIAFSEKPYGEIAYLLPVNISKNQEKIFLPKTYLTLLALLHYIRHLNQSSGNIDPLKIPLCQLSLEYDDIEDATYQAKYSVGLRDIEHYSEDPGPNRLFFSAVFEINRE